MNIVVGKTVHTINALLNKGAKKVSVLVDADDLLGIKILNENFPNKFSSYNITPDAEYKFLQQATNDCKKVVFLQNNFEINAQLLLKAVETMPENSAAFSSLALAKNKVVALKDLRTVDLDSVSQN